MLINFDIKLAYLVTKKVTFKVPHGLNWTAWHYFMQNYIGEEYHFFFLFEEEDHFLIPNL
jgi:hypothetical protein